MTFRARAVSAPVGGASRTTPDAIRDETVSAWLEELVGAHPEAPALISPTGEVFTFAQLATRVAALAAGLETLGARRSTRVAAFLPNGLAPVELFFAAARIGAVIVGVNTRFRSEDLRHVLEAARADILISSGGALGVDFVGIVRQAVASMDMVPQVVVDGPISDGWVDVAPEVVDLTSLRSPGRETKDIARSEDPVVAFTTSGTTGRPKLASHDQASVVRHARAAARSLGVGPGDIGLIALPFCGTFGFVSVLSVLAGGGCCVLTERFDAARSAQLVAQHG